ncbi:MAG: hypothetical protein KGI79_01020 [Patescibacteria group bacterium]|nr:hypothetical protein [Patescibacteria group bacterium]
MIALFILLVVVSFVVLIIECASAPEGTQGDEGFQPKTDWARDSDL